MRGQAIRASILGEKTVPTNKATLGQLRRRRVLGTQKKFQQLYQVTINDDSAYRRRYSIRVPERFYLHHIFNSKLSIRFIVNSIEKSGVVLYSYTMCIHINKTQSREHKINSFGNFYFQLSFGDVTRFQDVFLLKDADADLVSYSALCMYGPSKESTSLPQRKLQPIDDFVFLKTK